MARATQTRNKVLELVIHSVEKMQKRIHDIMGGNEAEHFNKQTELRHLKDRGEID